MRTFVTIWFGQLVSLLGTGMTRFALMIWAWQQTGNATTFALLGFCSYAPYILISPLAGMAIDRFDRRIIMLLADLGAGLSTGLLLLLYATGNLEVWHLFLIEGLSSASEAFQLPAYSAATTMLVDKSQYTRTSGMRSLAGSASTVLAPILSGAMLAAIGLRGIMLIDLATFVVAMGTLLAVRIPRPPVSSEAPAAGESKLKQLSFGWRYIRVRPGLLGLLIIYAGINLAAALTYFSILSPMVLARSGGSEMALATVQGAMGIGGVAGGLLITVWGGPKRRLHSCLLGAGFSFLLGDMLLALGRTVPAWSIAVFFGSFFIPFINSGERAIWQIRVAPDIQGRVFSTQEMLKLATFPLGFLLAGPLADHLFEPALASGGALAPALGFLVGTGPGAGMGFMFFCTAIMGALMSFGGYLVPAIRHVEDVPPAG